jgi:hypothetical protein
MGLSAPRRSPADAPRQVPHTDAHDALVHEIGLGVATLFPGRRHRKGTHGPGHGTGWHWVRTRRRGQSECAVEQSKEWSR